MAYECKKNACGCNVSSISPASTPESSGENPDIGHGVARYRIENMDCPTEEALIRDKLKGFPGVTGLEFNLLQRTLTIFHTLSSLKTVEEALKSIGMQVGTVDSQDELPKDEKTNWWPLIISGVAALSAEIIELASVGPQWLSLLLALVAILTGGLTVLVQRE